MIYHKSDKKRAKGQDWKVAFTRQIWGPNLFLLWDYGNAHTISEIIAQADARIKKLVRTRVFFLGFGAIDAPTSPLPKKKNPGL